MIALETGHRAHLADPLLGVGIEVAGAFPPPMAGFITMTAGVGAEGARGAAARALVTFLASPDVEPVLETHGMQPGR